MMARNRKFQTAAIRFGPALKAFVLCLLIGGSGVGYVWQKNQIDQLNAVRKTRELRLRVLNQENKRLQDQLQTLQLPVFIKKRIKDLNLGLAPAVPSQVWTLREPAAEPPRNQTRQYASQGNGESSP